MSTPILDNPDRHNDARENHRKDLCMSVLAALPQAPNCAYVEDLMRDFEISGKMVTHICGHLREMGFAVQSDRETKTVWITREGWRHASGAAALWWELREDAESRRLQLN